jgi:hypothetical protein
MHLRHMKAHICATVHIQQYNMLEPPQRNNGFTYVHKLHNGYEYFVLYLINKNNNIDFHFNFISDIRCVLVQHTIQLQALRTEFCVLNQ